MSCRSWLLCMAAGLVAFAALRGPVEAQTTVDDDDVLLRAAAEPWTGDLDGMLERGFVRVLTVYNPLYFSYAGKDESGIAADVSREFQKRLNEWYGKDLSVPLTVLVVPVPRDQLIPALLEGRGDLIDANLTITPGRQVDVAFSDPIYTDIDEVFVTGPAAGPVSDIEDLVAHPILVRSSSSYFEHLSALNENREEKGKAPFEIEAADEVLEDYDLLELVNAGLVPAVIVDSHKAALWQQVFDEITVHNSFPVHSDNEIAWAFRKDSPKLAAAVNRFVDEYKKGTLLGNIIFNRYFGDADWIENNRSDQMTERYQSVVAIIRQYAEEYDFDWLMITAQGFQESRLDQSKRSAAGAIGVMQVMPATASDPAVDIPNIEVTEPNIHAGVRYLRHVRSTYFDEPEISQLDQILLSFAAYNAGPGNIAKARKRAADMGLDPNIWFGNVEVAAARAISREPVIYVRNIYKYFVSYRRQIEARRKREAATDGVQ